MCVIENERMGARERKRGRESDEYSTRELVDVSVFAFNQMKMSERARKMMRENECKQESVQQQKQQQHQQAVVS